MSAEPDIARDGGPFNFNEAMTALDFHMARAARAGNDGLYADLNKIQEFVDDLQGKYERATERRRPSEVIFSSPFEPPEYAPTRRLCEDDEC